jgi:sugar lactone lactonase YvrE
LLFKIGQASSTTVVGNERLRTSTLSQSSDVVLDADGNLYIVDQYHQRIVVLGSNVLQCLAGCSGAIGVASNQLYVPQSFSFDSYDNMYVVDSGNNRIQKFMMMTNSYHKLIDIFC